MANAVLKLNAHTGANMSEIAVLIRQIIGWHVHSMLIINPNTRCFNLINVGTANRAYYLTLDFLNIFAYN